MNWRYLLTATLIVLVVCGSGAAADKKPSVIDGKWTGSFDDPFNGAISSTWEFSSEGDKLSAKVITDGSEQIITDLKIVKGKYVWTQRVNAFGRTMRMTFTATLKGEKLKIGRAMDEGSEGNGGPPGGFGPPGEFGPPGMEDEITAKRVK